MPGGTNILVSSGVVNNPFMSVKGLWETCCGIFNAGDAPLGNALFVGLLAFFTVVASSQISPQRPLRGLLSTALSCAMHLVWRFCTAKVHTFCVKSPSLHLFFNILTV